MSAESRRQPELAKEIARSAAADAVVSPHSKSYVPAPDFHGRGAQGAKTKTRFAAAFALLVAATAGLYALHPSATFERKPASLAAVSATASFSLVPATQAEIEALPEPERANAREGKSRVVYLTVISPGALGAIVTVQLNGRAAGQLELGIPGARVPVAIETGKSSMITETLAHAVSGANEFSVVTTDGERISRPMKVGETITWTVRAL